MTVNRESIPKYFKLYSSGLEKEYRGKTILYKETAKTAVFYYYDSLKRGYIIADGGNSSLPCIDGQIEILSKYDGTFCRRFRKILKECEKKIGNEIYTYPDIFYRKLEILIKDKKWNMAKTVSFCINFQKYYGEK